MDVCYCWSDYNKNYYKKKIVDVSHMPDVPRRLIFIFSLFLVLPMSPRSTAEYRQPCCLWRKASMGGGNVEAVIGYYHRTHGNVSIDYLNTLWPVLVDWFSFVWVAKWYETISLLLLLLLLLIYIVNGLSGERTASPQIRFCQIFKISYLTRVIALSYFIILLLLLLLLSIYI
jgi:hypothetical protein